MIDVNKITIGMATTPKNAGPNYDWTKEEWVDDARVRALSFHIAGHVLAAMRVHVAVSDIGQLERKPTPQECEDARVFTLLRPDLTEYVLKSKDAFTDGPMCYREWTAAAQGIDRMISLWIEKLGNVDAEIPKKPEEKHEST